MNSKQAGELRLNYQLRNQNNIERTFKINQATWYGLLDLAEEHGWNPMGTILLEPLYEIENSSWSEFKNLDQWDGDYWTHDGRLVLFEDALNLADALESAFLNYQPTFQTSIYDFFPTSNNHSPKNLHPSIGAIRILIDFCQLGAFYIEKT
jgi:hypothetical protein